jgi:hypothetical protein
MKKLFFVLALVGFASFAAQAQSCCSKGAKGASASADKTEASCSTSAADKAASLDDSIEKRVDEASGKVSFVRRTVNAASGESTYAPVEYCSESNAFVSKSGDKKACCTDGKKSKGDAACCSKESKSKASKTSAALIKAEE